jgi:hypothetical protein
MHAAISIRRIVSICCLLLTLVISLFIGNYFADEGDQLNSEDASQMSSIEGLTMPSPASAPASARSSAPASAPASARSSAPASAPASARSSAPSRAPASAPSRAPASAPATTIEEFALQYSTVSNETRISTSPDKQPPMPSKYNTVGVFNRVFSMSNPNEQFVIPRI